MKNNKLYYENIGIKKKVCSQISNLLKAIYEHCSENYSLIQPGNYNLNQEDIEELRAFVNADLIK